MNWRNVKLICFREMRDQLRDRRTLFMIAVLPLLLYPLLGISFLQLSQFLTDHPSRVLIVDLPALPDLPPWVGERDHETRFAEALLPDKQKSDLLAVDVKSSAELAAETKDPATKKDGGVKGEAKPIAPAPSPADIDLLARQWMQANNNHYDVVVYFPSDFKARVEQFRAAPLKASKVQSNESQSQENEIPAPQFFYNSARDQSQIALGRVEQLIHQWLEAVNEQNLRDNHIPQIAAKPFVVQKPTDIAEPGHAGVWAKVLPLVLLLWALTGAFYPAVDLCAGEKERGTLETLLSSPAERSEIVAGKLLTVMAFSMATSLLNLASMAVTGLLVMRQFGNVQALAASGLPLGMPPWTVWPWLLIALVPVSALFSALCLALAAFARSSKEGQYYLMPLVLVTLPLLILPMAPGVELTWGNSLIPMTGLVLLLRQILDGNGLEALPFIAPVIIVTGLCCYTAVRWAIDQFNTESVLFADTERLDLGLWLKHLVRDRKDTPTVGAAVTCGILVLVGEFFLALLMPPNTLSTFGDAVSLALSSQLAIIVPVILMTVLFTRSPKKTLLIRSVRPSIIAAVLGLNVAVVPLYTALGFVLHKMYPTSKSAEAAYQMIEGAINKAPAWWMALLLIGMLPAVCEELAFRGFILSGLRHTGHKWRAIFVSALFFGATHQVLQQSAGAFLLGILIAFIAVQTNSLWPGLLFHLTHNSLMWIPLVA